MRGARRIGVPGVGNVLMSDDGIGPLVLKILESRYEFPSNAKPSICWEEKAPSEFSEEEYEDVSGHSG
jgi:Ni,Fe-hydrogenase maturation factor